MHCSTFSREIVLTSSLEFPTRQRRRIVLLIEILIIQCMESPSFKDLGICDELVEACVALGWANPTPVQAQAIPLALQDKDLIGLAQTGSGKTAAFIIPILQALLKASGPRFFFACVISPTRELAIQISEQFHALGSGIGLKCAVVVGGMNRVSEAIELGKRPHVLVGTPGRLLDHLSNTKGFNLRNLKFLVLDEADKLLDQDFGEVIDKILREVPKQRRTFLFSATMTKKVAKLQRLCLTNPAKVEVSFKYSVVDTLKQQIVVIPPQHKDCYLVFLLTEKIGKCVMVFTRTCDATTRVAMMLRILGFGAIPINGHMTQSKRLGALSKFKAGDRNILVCTDVASRGLDIQGVDLVINYDLPTNSKDYIHRVGRTARAGKSGLAISFVTMYDAILCVLQRIEDSIGEKLTKIDLPEEEVFLLKERVTEAQNIAKHQMKDHDSSKKRKRRNENDDEIEM